MEAIKIDLKDTTSVSEAMEKAGLLFEATPIGLVRADGRDVISHKAVVRSDNGMQLGIVGKNYSIIQNSEHAAMISAIVSKHEGARLDSAILYDGGRRVRITATLGEFTIENGKLKKDSIRKLITVENSFDGSSGFPAIMSLERVVCSNGMTRKTKESFIKIQHSGNTESKMLEAMRIMGLAEKHFTEFQIICQTLATQIIDKKLVDDFLNNLLGDLESTRSKNVASEIEALIGNGIETYGQTRFDLLNATTEYYDHHNGSDDAKRLASATIGNGANKKATALEYLIHA